MSAVPLEMITMLGSALFGGLTKLTGLALDISRQKQLLQLQLMGAQGKLIADARNTPNRSIQWTRRAIALLAVFFIIAFPKLVAVWAPWCPVTVGYTEAVKGFLWFAGPAQLHWQEVHGLVLTPLDTHMLAAITGLYFGGSLAQH